MGDIDEEIAASAGKMRATLQPFSDKYDAPSVFQSPMRPSFLGEPRLNPWGPGFEEAGERLNQFFDAYRQDIENILVTRLGWDFDKADVYAEHAFQNWAAGRVSSDHAILLLGPQFLLKWAEIYRSVLHGRRDPPIPGVASHNQFFGLASASNAI